MPDLRVGVSVNVTPCWGRAFVAVIVALDGAWCWVQDQERTRLVLASQVTVLAQPPPRELEPL